MTGQTFIALKSLYTPHSTLGTVVQVKAMVALLNSCGALPLESEVVIAVPTLHLLSTKAMIRSDIAIAAEVRTFVIFGIRRCKNDILQQPPMAISELGCCFQCRLWCSPQRRWHAAGELPAARSALTSAARDGSRNPTMKTPV